MGRRLVVLSACVFAISFLSLVIADDYVEDVYYWDEGIAQPELLMPSYNPRAKEIIFIEDSATLLHPDTVRAILREKPL